MLDISRRDIFDFGEWQAAISLQTGEKGAIYRWDDAKVHQKFEKLAHEAGVRRDYTTAYSPEENRVTERFDRTNSQG